MIFSLRNASTLFSKFAIVFCGCNAITMSMFFLVMFCEREHIQWGWFLVIVVPSAAIGLATGLYIKFRSEFTSLYSIVTPPLMMGMFEIAFVGSAVALAIIIAGRPDVRWLAFNTNAFCMLLTIAMGMLLEARALGLSDDKNRWREEIEKYIDYVKRQVNPELTTKPHNMDYRYLFWLAVPIAVNIPLLFELYGGGRNNAIFFAAPLGIITFSYVNLRTFGPALTRLLLLRRIEKEVGYRFQNADYEQIQELRRGFFLSRWLMKDYRPPKVESFSITESDNSNLPVETKRKRKKKNRR